MPIFFSHGFALVDDAKPIVCVPAVAMVETELTGIWPMEASSMTCSDNTCGCPPSGAICLPKGDQITVLVTVRQNTCDGNLFDISGASEIVFIVADQLGGNVLITKRLSLGEVFISTNGYQFYTTITGAESELMENTLNYFEARVTTSSGANRTVITGVVRAPNTMIKDL